MILETRETGVDFLMSTKQTNSKNERSRNTNGMIPMALSNIVPYDGGWFSFLSDPKRTHWSMLFLTQ